MGWWRQERHGPDYMGRLYAMERALNTDEIKPVIVMGGGAAGITAAIAAARQGAKVTLLEREKIEYSEFPADFLKSSGDSLMDELDRLRVEIISKCKVVEIVREKEHYWTVVTAMGDLWIEFKADALVMAVGTGEGYMHNDGAGLFFLKKLGVPPLPADIYLAGELLKPEGPEGWDCVIKLQWALTTGYIAGKSAADAAKRKRQAGYD